MNTICPECEGFLHRIYTDEELQMDDGEAVGLFGCSKCHKVYWASKTSPIPSRSPIFKI